MLAHGAHVIDVEVVAPEAFEGAVVIGREEALALREEHAQAGELAVVDAPRALEDETLAIGEPAGVHVGVAHPSPVVGRAVFHRAEVLGDAQRVGPPDDVDRMAQCQRLDGRAGHEGVRALVVGVGQHLQAWRCGGGLGAHGGLRGEKVAGKHATAHRAARSEPIVPPTPPRARAPTIA